MGLYIHFIHIDIEQILIITKIFAINTPMAKILHPNMPITISFVLLFGTESFEIIKYFPSFQDRKITSEKKAAGLLHIGLFSILQ